MAAQAAADAARRRTAAAAAAAAKPKSPTTAAAAATKAADAKGTAVTAGGSKVAALTAASTTKKARQQAAWEGKPCAYRHCNLVIKYPYVCPRCETAAYCRFFCFHQAAHDHHDACRDVTDPFHVFWTCAFVRCGRDVTNRNAHQASRRHPPVRCEQCRTPRGGTTPPLDEHERMFDRFFPHDDIFKVLCAPDDGVFFHPTTVRPVADAATRALAVADAKSSAAAAGAAAATDVPDATAPFVATTTTSNHTSGGRGVTGLMKDLLRIVVRYLGHAPNPNEWIELRELRASDFYLFARVDAVDPAYHLTSPPAALTLCAPLLSSRNSQAGCEVHYQPDRHYRHRRDWKRTPEAFGGRPTHPTPATPRIVQRLHVAELRVYDSVKMRAGDPWASVPPPPSYLAVPLPRATAGAGADDGWVVVTRDWDDGLCQVEFGGIDSHRIRRPEPIKCFASGHVLCPAATSAAASAAASPSSGAAVVWRDVWSLREGDAVCTPRLDALNDATTETGDALKNADVPPYTVHHVVRVDAHAIAPGDTFRLVTFDDPHAAIDGDDSDAPAPAPLRLTRGHPVFVPAPTTAGAAGAAARPSSSGSSGYEWMRPDELVAPVRQPVARVCNFVLSGGFSLICRARVPNAHANAHVKAATTTPAFVIASTLGADCGARLAALEPAYHAAYGPSQRPTSG